MGNKLSRIYYLLFWSLFFLVVGLLLGSFWSSQPSDESSYVAEIQENFTQQIFEAQKQVVPVIEQLENNVNPSFTDLQTSSNYSYFVFDRGRMIYWSDYRYIPAYRFL
ncbi:MAG: hypothetical protein AAFN93_17355, partial [Bacteroidota bacterium]